MKSIENWHGQLFLIKKVHCQEYLLFYWFFAHIIHLCSGMRVIPTLVTYLIRQKSSQ